MSNLAEVLEQNSGIKLDLGCGGLKKDGWVGLDRRAVQGVDIVHDLEVFPWPLPDDICVTILCSHILEHIDPRNFFAVMAEIWRIGKHGCQVQISTPYAGSFGAYQDPSHVRPGFNEATWSYFDPRPINGEVNVLYQVYMPPPFLTERLHWAVQGNMECLLRVYKDEKSLKEIVAAGMKTEVVRT